MDPWLRAEADAIATAYVTGEYRPPGELRLSQREAAAEAERIVSEYAGEPKATGTGTMFGGDER